MGEAYQEMPNAAPLDERAASIPGHVERIMLRDYAPVNEGFHILYDAAELLRRNADAITTLRAENAAATDLVNEYSMAIIRMQGERDTLRAALESVDEKALEVAHGAGNRVAPYSVTQKAYRAAISAYLAAIKERVQP